MLAPGAPSPSRPWLSSAPELGAAIRGEGSAQAALHQETDAFCPTSAIREDIMPSPDLLPQSPTPPQIIDVAIADRSHILLDIKNMGDHPPSPSCGQHNIA